MLSLRIDRDLLERLQRRATKRGMSVQDYVIRTLMRDDFDERFQAAVEETERFYGAVSAPGTPEQTTRPHATSQPTWTTPIPPGPSS
ncbi:hypothetical protein GCM10023083_87860 [Streptomyces phyllanthi]